MANTLGLSSLLLPLSPDPFSFPQPLPPTQYCGHIFPQHKPLALLGHLTSDVIPDRVNLGPLGWASSISLTSCPFTKLNLTSLVFLQGNSGTKNEFCPNETEKFPEQAVCYAKYGGGRFCFFRLAIGPYNTLGHKYDFPIASLCFLGMSHSFREEI